MGGYNGSNLDDIFLLNISTERCGRVSQGAAGPFTFHSVKNAAALASDNCIVSLVEGGQDGKPYLIKFSKGEDSVTLTRSILQ